MKAFLITLVAVVIGVILGNVIGKKLNITT
jgi:hypothetical protein